MRLIDALSQLAILGATSIVLRNGQSYDLEEADGLLEHVGGSASFGLHGREAWVDVVELASGRLFGHACTIWARKIDRLMAVGG
jgi:hypothetical protein